MNETAGELGTVTRIGWILFQVDSMSDSPLGTVSEDDIATLDTSVVMLQANSDRLSGESH